MGDVNGLTLCGWFGATDGRRADAACGRDRRGFA